MISFYFRTNADGVQVFVFKRYWIAVVVALLLCSSRPLFAEGDASENRFYHGQNYGSESQFGGLNVFINAGFVVSGRYTTPYIFDDLDYNKNFNIVLKSFTQQSATVRENGGGSRLWSEYNPFDSSGRFLPNFGLHFIGEGMLSRKLEEYYRVEGYSYPRASAIATVVATQLMNEAAEADMEWYNPIDSLADIYWNIAGIAAFSYDGFAQMFSNDLVNLYYWPGQPVIDISDGGIYNQGESYLLRAGRNKLKLAVAMGVPVNGIGASYSFNGYDNYTLLLGTDFALPRTDWQKPGRIGNESSKEVIISMAVPSLQFYWDRDGSLMASLGLGQTTQCSDGLRAYKEPSGQTACENAEAKPVTRSHISMNLYPVEMGSVSIGGYFILSEAGASSAGITFNYPPVTIGRRFD